ncbi:hypothetical protein [Bacillus sp. ISL-37]|uniref:hypothetical protein n=1 Tax=Bacillus sp. ISL-37 TaxID=2819123 RepID=UPI001BEB800D|nr:hypothetical protein [Bacillus sp. ISL-37]MBT2682629.1 hypothetical protein [Bacillus sp. ISL-37]
MKNKKEYNFEGTRVTIVSKLAHLTDEERGEYMRRQLAEGNPVYKEIEMAVNACYNDKTKSRED